MGDKRLEKSQRMIGKSIEKPWESSRLRAIGKHCLPRSNKAFNDVFPILRYKKIGEKKAGRKKNRWGDNDLPVPFSGHVNST